MYFCENFQTRTLPSLGLLAMRLTMGAAFIFHGWGKVQSATSWMGDSLPGILQAFAAYSEFGGGILLILGLITPLAALGILGTMIGALSLVHVPAGHPFVGQGGPSSELALVYLSAAILFLLNSPGKFSLDYVIAQRMKPNAAPTS